MERTHHADDETLEYIASLEQRNAELLASLRNMTSCAVSMSDAIHAEEMAKRIRVSAQLDDAWGALSVGIEQSSALLAKTKE
jgi:hypothetical protein